MYDRIKSRERSRRYRQRQRLLNPKSLPGKHGHHAKGERNGRWNNDLKSSHGYVLVRVGDGNERGFGSRRQYRYQHDILMESRIGRPLAGGEVVHHKNGDKSDNRIDNLELTTPSRHQRYHANNTRLRDALGRFAADLRVREFPDVERAS